LSCYVPFFGCVVAGAMIGWRGERSPELEV